MSEQLECGSNAEDDALWMTLSISPAPAADEGEALIAAISVYLAAKARSAGAGVPVAPVSRWMIAGRRTAIRGVANSPAMGWGRGRAGWP